VEIIASKFFHRRSASMVEKVTKDEYRRAKAHGYARWWDGYRYMLRLDEETGGTIWKPVEISDL